MTGAGEQPDGRAAEREAELVDRQVEEVERDVADEADGRDDVRLHPGQTPNPAGPASGAGEPPLA